MLRLQHHITTVVVSKRIMTDRIALYELADPADWDLPPFSAGAHINIHLPNGVVRPYSLCGNSAVKNRYSIAIQREDAGRGGSAAMHRQLKVGTVVAASLPKNDFSLMPEASKYLLIAGGIGITPILAMAEELAQRNAVFSLHYTARRPEEMAFRDYLHDKPWRDRVHLYFSQHGARTRLGLRGLLSKRESGEHVYCCGPNRLIDEIPADSSESDAASVHIERFSGGSAAPNGRFFTVTLSASGREIPVFAGETIVEALRKVGIEISTSCEAGVCSTCKVRYLSGSPDHRDLVLSHAQRQQYMLPCVSGALGDRLVLDM